MSPYDRTCGTDTPPTCNGGFYDAFVTKYNAAGTVAYSTFVGGSDFDEGFGIAVGRGGSDAGTAYVVGSTSSTDYPTTPGARQTTYGGGGADAFVTKLNATGSDRVYSTFLGGQQDEFRSFGVPGIAVNSAGNAFVSGRSRSANFPIVRPVAEAGDNLYVAEFNTAGSDLVFSTHLGGGNGAGEATGMALDSAGNAYVTGTTSAADLATQNPFQAKLANGGIGSNAFVAKVSPASDANLAAPYVLDVSPKGGDLPGGRQVKITGTGFAGASAVAFGGVAAASFTVDSTTQITAVSPAHAPGRAAVTVTTAQGTSPPNPLSRFAYGDGMFATTGAVPFTFSSNLVSGGPPTATLLKTGKVLVAGGGTALAVLYDPKAGTFAATGSLTSAKSGSTATLLPSGKVLIMGDKGELYDAASGTFSATTGAPLFSTFRGTATLLKTGKVLITAGGKQTQLYDPVTDTFSATAGSQINDHGDGQATLLPDGKVLLAGGPPAGGASSQSAEFYDPASGTFTATGALNTGRIRFKLTPLPSGKVLASGGLSRLFGATTSAELYDPQTGDWTVTGSLDDFRYDHVATLLPTGKVLITGGTASGSAPVAGAELFDPAAGGGQGAFTSAGRNEHPIAQPAAALLSSDPASFAADPAVCGDGCGKVLVAGSGRTVTPSTFSTASAAELYTLGVPSPGPGPGPGGGGPGSGTPPSGLTSSGATSDTSAPGVSGYGLTNNPFVVGGSTPTFGSAAKAKRHKKGTTFRYTLSEAATVRITIAQRLAGRRRGKRCVAPTRKLRKAKKCTRISTRGTLTRISKAGANRVAFSGRIGSRKLGPGSYQATLTATDSAKNSSKPRTIKFTIVKR